MTGTPHSDPKIVKMAREIRTAIDQFNVEGKKFDVEIVIEGGVKLDNRIYRDINYLTIDVAINFLNTQPVTPSGFVATDFYRRWNALWGSPARQVFSKQIRVVYAANISAGRVSVYQNAIKINISRLKDDFVSMPDFYFTSQRVPEEINDFVLACITA